MIVASVSISLAGSIVALLPLLLVVISAAILFYRFTLPPLPRGRRLLLSTLRALALGLLLFIIFEPVLRLTNKNQQPPSIAVLIDDSQSVGIDDGKQNRPELIKQFLAGTSLSSLPSNTRPVYYRFSSGLRPLSARPAIDSSSFAGQTTNLSEALARLKEQLPRENIQAVALLSDGNYTAGKNPIYDAEALGVPIYAIGIGDTMEQKDIVVEKVLANNLAYADTRVPVDVTIRSSGFDNQNVEVMLSESGSIIDRKVVALKQNIREYPVHLVVEPKGEGTKKYLVSVSPVAGELTERNNAHSFFMKVLRSKLHLTLLAGAPSPDVAALRQVFLEDEHLRVRSFVQKSSGNFYEGSMSRSILDSTDCFILVGYPSSASNTAVIRQLRDVIEQSKKPVLFVNSRTVDYSALQQLEGVLPFGWSGGGTGEAVVFPSIVERQKNHPLVTLEGVMTDQSWQQLPPIYKSQITIHAKPESNILAQVKIQNVVLNEPLVVLRNVNRQKSFAITGHGVWRWKLLAQNNSQTEKFLSLLMTNAVRWLTTKEEEKNVRVHPLKEAFTTAEPAEFYGQVYDDQLQPVDNADLRVEVVRGSEKFDIALNAVGHGRYEGKIDGLGEGDYVFTGRASGAGKMYGEDRGRFSVGQMNVEFIETRMNKQLLEQIAYRSGGKYYSITDGGQVAEDLSRDSRFVPKEIIEASEIELWNWRYLGACIILLLAIEWFLRKRSGML